MLTAHRRVRAFPLLALVGLSAGACDESDGGTSGDEAGGAETGDAETGADADDADTDAETEDTDEPPFEASCIDLCILYGDLECGGGYGSCIGACEYIDYYKRQCMYEQLLTSSDPCQDGGFYSAVC